MLAEEHGGGNSAGERPFPQTWFVDRSPSRPQSTSASSSSSNRNNLTSSPCRPPPHDRLHKAEDVLVESRACCLCACVITHRPAGDGDHRAAVLSVFHCRRYRVCARCARARQNEVVATYQSSILTMAAPMLATLNAPDVPLDKTESEFDERSVLARNVGRLVFALEKLRRALRAVKKLFGAGLYAIEVSVSPSGGSFHPHIHIVANAPNLDVAQLRRVWTRASGCDDPRAVDVRPVVRSEADVEDVLRYVSKPINDADAYARLIILASTLRRRLLQPFGGLVVKRAPRLSRRVRCHVCGSYYASCSEDWSRDRVPLDEIDEIRHRLLRDGYDVLDRTGGDTS